MKYVKLTEAEEFTITEIRKFHPKQRVRERAQMIELSNKKKEINQIVNIVGKNRDTVSTWLNKYEKYGIAGLFDGQRSGRRPKVKDQIKEKIMEIAESDITCTSQYITEIIEKEFNVKLHPNTIKYNLKKQDYIYKRTRNSLKKKRDEKKI